MKMNMYHNRPHVEDIRAMKKRGEKISMLYVTTIDEAAAAAAAGINMLSIESRFFSPEMREAAGDCFIQVGLPYGPHGPLNSKLVNADDYLRLAYEFSAIGGDCFYCAASYDIQKTLCDNHVPIVAHVGLIPSYITWTGWRAVGKTADEAYRLWENVKRLEVIGAFGAELEVVPDRIGEWISKNTSLIMLGMGAGSGADAQYLFTEDVLGYGVNHKPRHGKVYRNFKVEFERLHSERVVAFKEFIDDVNSSTYPSLEHVVTVADDEFADFLKRVEA
jgi:3-methyl-2-oxobutanoate hydroxymethyltransferase